ncbi:MAG: SpoIIE family protein phosphatase [Flavobacteriales bacterium]|jgi:serine phosphatase RsbU (regulator of sigma subunit)|nr:SpoIIE family protein phosphatase [Flavobacteriales bacterium]
MNYIKIVLIALLSFLASVSYSQDKVTLLKEKLEASPKEEKPHVLNMLSKTLLRKNRKESLAYAEEAIKLSQDLGDVAEEMDGYLNKGKALSALRKHTEAIQAIEKVLKVDQEFGNEPSAAYDLSLLGKEYTSLKKFSDARNSFQESYDIYTKLKDERALGYVAGDYANMEKKANDRKKAIKWFEVSLAHHQKSKNKQGEVQAMMAIGALNANRGDYEKAIKQLQEAKDKAKQYGLNSLEKSAAKNLSIVQENQEKKASSVTDVDIENQNDIARRMNDYEDMIILSDEKISELSETMQILELKKRLEKEAYDREIKEKEEEKLKLEQAKKLAETVASAAKAEEEKVAAKNDLLAAQNAKQTTMIIGGGIGLALLAILILFVLKSNRERKKANEALVAKNELIEEQKNSLEEQKAELEHKNHNIKESLDYAKKIQTSILPPIGGLKEKFSDSFVFFRPKDIVSGDFYWYYEHGSKLYVSVSDCTGHGVPGAFMSIIGNNLIEKAIVELKIDKPADVLKFMSDRINEQLGMSTGVSEVKDGMDMTLICIDKSNNKLSFAGARNPLYFYRAGQLEEVKATKMSVGYNSKKVASEFENIEMDLLKGDRLYMFSDGFADQKGGPKGKKFYYRPFREILQGSGTQSMDFQRDLLENTIVEWMNGAEQLDDMLVLGIEI